MASAPRPPPAGAEDDAPLVARPGPLWSVGGGGARSSLLSAAALSHGRAAGRLASADAAPGALLRGRNAPLLAVICVYSFVAAALISIASPFLPLELHAVGASSALVGAVFAAYPLVNLLLSPACTPLCQRLGRRRVLLLGLVLEAVTAAAMGAVPVRPRAGWAYLALRCCQGAGAALSYTALLAYAAERFAGALATVVGIQEAVAGVGYMVGPPLGGALYSLGGFALPFVTMGAGLLAVLPFLPAALPADGDGEAAQAAQRAQPRADRAAGRAPPPPAPVSFLRVAALPGVMDAAAVTLLSGVAFGFVGPTLAPHLATTLLASEAAIGAMFGLCAAAYALAAPAMGAAADALGARRVMSSGVAALALSYILLGPSPLLGAPPAPGGPAAWASQALALVLLGAGAAAAIIPCLPQMEREAVAALGCAETGAAESVAALFNAMYCGGEAAGPMVGAALVGALGFRWAATLVALALGAYCAAAAAAAARAHGRCADAEHAAWWRALAARLRGRGRDQQPLGEPLLLDEEGFGDEPRLL